MSSSIFKCCTRGCASSMLGPVCVCLPLFLPLQYPQVLFMCLFMFYLSMCPIYSYPLSSGAVLGLLLVLSVSHLFLSSILRCCPCVCLCSICLCVPSIHVLYPQVLSVYLLMFCLCMCPLSSGAVRVFVLVLSVYVSHLFLSSILRCCPCA